MRNRLLTILSLFIFSLSTFGFSQSVDKKGFEIASKSIEMDQGFKSLSTKLKMKKLSNIYSGRKLSLILKKSEDSTNTVVYCNITSRVLTISM